MKLLIQGFLQSLGVLISYCLLVFFSNPGEMPYSDLAKSILEVFVVVCVIYTIVWICLRQFVDLIPISIVILLLWLPIKNFVSQLSFLNFPISLLSLLTLSILWAASCFFIKKFNEKNILKINAFIAFITIFGTITEIILFNKSNPQDYTIELVSNESNKNEYDKILTAKVQNQSLPNVIYLVPDRYGNKLSIKENFNYDNSSFYDELRKRQFTINEESRSNYPFTELSLSSTLNNSYLKPTDAVINESSLFPLIKNGSAFNTFVKLGYQFYNFDNWWFGSQGIKSADYNFIYSNDESLSGPANYLYKIQTPIYSVLRTIFGDKESKKQCMLLQKYFDEIKNTVTKKQDQPYFIFAHLLAPHDPYLFNQNGECNIDAIRFSNISSSEYLNQKTWEKRKNYYLDYLTYTNNQILEIFDIAKIGSSRELIFVIQADEGPYPYCFLINNDGRYSLCSEQDWEIKTGILNAIYISEDNNFKSSDLISPINNFQHVFEKISQTTLKKKEHNFFIIKDRDKRMDFEINN